MKVLDRKLWRELVALKGQAVAIALVVASGVALFVMSSNAAHSLQESQTAHYDHARFADVFTHVKRAPKSLEQRVAHIPGVARVQTRVVMEVTLDVPGLAEPAVGRLISLPERQTAMLNDLHLRSGRYIEADRPEEVLVSEAFAQAHNFQPGDLVLAIINGRRQQLTMVGIVLSPEYVIQIRSGGVFPDDKRFGVFWMGERALSAAFKMTGAFNDLTLTLMPNASEAEVIHRLDRLLTPYGSGGAYGRKDQVSHAYLSDEIKGVQVMASIAPTIFLAVAAFLMNVVLARLIASQRQQIAILKTFGYSSLEVGLHYLKLALLIATVGAALGIAAGVWLGVGMTNMYAQFYRFPTSYYPGLGVMAIGCFLSLAAASVGVFTAVRRAIRLPAAEAMRAEPPAKFRTALIERIGLKAWFSPAMRMVLRNLERKPLTALFSAFGIALAVAILIVGSFGEDSMDYMMEFQFQHVQRQDMMVALVEPSSQRTLQDLKHLPGVLHAEPYRILPVRIRAEHRSRRLGIMGIERAGDLMRLLDDQEQPVALPEDGLLLSEKLAELLGVKIGDSVTVEVLEGQRPISHVSVTGIIAEYAGVTAYMHRSALNRLAHEGSTISGALLAVDSTDENSLFTTLKNTPRVASVTVKQAAMTSFKDTIEEGLLQMRGFMIFFSSIIAFGVVYNSARISLSERSRELSTLRIIGFTRREISLILLGEIAIITIIAIPIGLVLGYGLTLLMSWSLDTELYRIPVVIDRSSYAFAAVVVIIATIASGLIVQRKLNHLDLVSVLKAGE